MKMKKLIVFLRGRNALRAVWCYTVNLQHYSPVNKGVSCNGFWHCRADSIIITQ